MNTKDFVKTISSKKLSENLEKQFNARVKLTKYTREELEDMRNKLRTKVFQQEHSAGYNDLLTNETYQKDMAMLQLLNTRIKEMLGEDIKKLKDKMIELSEGKKGVKVAKHPQGSKKSTKDYDGDGKVETPKDEVWGSRAKAAAKSGKPFSETAVSEDESLPAAKKKETTWTDKSGKKHPATKVQGSRSVAADKDADKERKAGDKVKEDADDRKPAKEKEREVTLPSGAKVKARTVQGWQSQKADKNSDKEKDLDEAKDKCNHTPKGKKCLVHGLKECGTMEGKDEGKPGKNFAKIAKAAGGGEKGKRIAGKVRADLAKAGKLEEANQVFKTHVRLVNEGLTRLLNEDEEGKAKAITAASDIVNDFTSWMQRVGQYQTKAIIELADAIKADFGAAEAETFKQAVAPALASTLETLTSQREVISAAVAALAGEAPAEPPMGMEPDMAGPEEPGMDTAAPDELNPEPAGDEFGAADAAGAGREVRESKFARKLAESHSIMSKLAR